MATTVETFATDTLVAHIDSAVQHVVELRSTGRQTFSQISFEEEYELVEDSLNVLVAELANRAFDIKAARESINLKAGPAVPPPWRISSDVLERALRVLRERELYRAFVKAGQLPECPF